MARDMEHILEQTQCDYSWAPRDVLIVDRPEVTYVHSKRTIRMYKSVVRLRAPDSEHKRLVDEVLRAHAQTESEWRLSNLSRSEDLENSSRPMGTRSGPSASPTHCRSMLHARNYRRIS